MEVWLGTYLRHGISGFFADYVFDALTPDRFRDHLASPCETFIVSQNREGIDGFIRVTEGPEPPEGQGSSVEIATLYVQPRHHGRGIGQALLQAGVQVAADLGASQPWLTTNAENTAAIAFYRRQGFEVTGQTFFKIGGEAYPNVVLTYQT